MVTIKSSREIELMREAGRIVAYAHRKAAEAIRPGITTKELDQIVEDAIRSQNAIPSFLHYDGYPASACISVNEEVVHGIPSSARVLKEGDLVSIDIGANYKGYHGDSAWSHACGRVSDEVRHLLEATEASLYEGLARAKPGARLTDISHAIQTYAEKEGFTIVREMVGHGIGQHLHEDPQIPNFGLPGRGITLRKGMTLAIEPMVNAGVPDIKILRDGWTAVTRDGRPSAHFEHTILITDTGYEILTKE
ncbi:MAG: type I methionyl aminopeptidase [Candidatus Izemoplasmatales bacterium]